MWDYFWQRMESSRGDLADIVQSGSRAGPSPSTAALEFDPVVAAAGWQQHPPPQPAAFPAGNPNTALQLDRRGVEHEFWDGGGACRPGEREALGIRPCSDDLLRVLQISPAGGGSSPSPLTPGPSPAATHSGAVDHGGGVQQISPRALGIKRRKSQAKKVVCIPAPIAASSRQSTGEVVPSDLWAWRKYGQKPIKGSPYPRGYYRCSSTKGCLARKQVERSRTDPNMLVITYTSEHNHPWPTQRNALAGSTRSHSMSKNSNNARIKTSPAAAPKEDEEAAAGAAAEEEEEEEDEIASEIQKKDRVTPAAAEDHEELDQIMHYRPMIPEPPGLPDDLFAELAELEEDPVSLIFSKGFMEAAKPEGDEERGLQKAPAMDPFTMFDWGASS